LHAGDGFQHSLLRQLIPYRRLCDRHRENLDFLASFQD
jgi:hypothetical protein